MAHESIPAVLASQRKRSSSIVTCKKPSLKWQQWMNRVTSTPRCPIYVKPCTRVYKDLQGFKRIYKGIQGFTGVYKGIQAYARVNRGIQEYTRVNRCIEGYARVYKDLQGYIRVYRGIKGL